jgi:hypothetical protein
MFVKIGAGRQRYQGQLHGDSSIFLFIKVELKRKWIPSLPSRAREIEHKQS